MHNLTYLKILDLSQWIPGHLPQELCRRGLLEKFIANSNYFTGSIPKSLKNCTSLYWLRLDWNQLTGNISEDFGIYPHLYYVDLSYNNFYSELSSKWGDFCNMTSFKISNNNVFGEIPPELGKATWLQLIDFSSNYLEENTTSHLQVLDRNVREFVDSISISPPNDSTFNYKSGSRFRWVEESSLYLSFNRLLYLSWK
jgi:hypothetical protein